MDSADVVLVNSRLRDVSAAIRLSRATLRNIYENLFWAFAYNIILIPMAAGLYRGIQMNPMWGAAAMSLSSFTVCMNALRLNLVKVHSAKHDRKKKWSAAPTVSEDTAAAPELTVSEAAAPLEPVSSVEAPVPAAAPSGLHTGLVMVEGMMCNNCERHVKNALEALPEIESAAADYTKGTVVITYTALPDEDAMREALAEEDYEYVSFSPEESL